MESNHRPSKPEWLMSIARTTATRATCDRAHVGCVIVRNGDRIIATGYNGSPPGMPHCDDDGHDMVDGHCLRTIHAEENALLQCAKLGISTNGATCYSTTQPCIKCTKALYAAGVRAIWYQDEYYTWSVEDAFRLREFVKYGLKVFRLHEDGVVEDVGDKILGSLPLDEQLSVVTDALKRAAESEEA